MADYTPGPWVYAPTGSVMRDEYSQPYGVVGATQTTLVAGVFGDVAGGGDVAQANARLIAAAPELAQSVIELHRILHNGMTDDYDFMCEALGRAAAAMRKAGVH